MRAIGKLINQDLAEKFYLICLHQSIEVQFDKTENEPVIWILDEEHIAQAKSKLEAFADNPESPRWQVALKEGALMQQKLLGEKKAAPASKRVEPSYIVTGSLISISVFAYLANQFAAGKVIGKLLAFSNYYYASYSGFFNLPEIWQGQIWRLFTPIFLHANLLHLGFNMLWFYQLGRQIEENFSSRLLLGLTLTIATISHLFFYLVVGPHFVGMSGVIYGLCTFLWAVDRFDPNRLRGLDTSSATFLMYWYVFCLALTVVGMGVANTIHGMGALLGYFAGLITTKAHRQFNRRMLRSPDFWRQIALGASLLLCGMAVDVLTKI